jgi:acetate kinase
MHGFDLTWPLQPSKELNLIVLHLGSGASGCCIKHGKSLDTSMSLTPVDGLPGATRTGSIDPTAILHYMRKSGASIDGAESELKSKSGWEAMTGTSSFGDLVASKKGKDQLAFNLVVDRVMNYVGAYWTKLEGQVDALVFAGGIGEKSPQLRAEIAGKCKCLGAELHARRNLTNDTKEVQKTVRSIGDGKMRILVVRTDKQHEMALQCSLDGELYDSEPNAGCVDACFVNNSSELRND